MKQKMFCMKCKDTTYHKQKWLSKWRVCCECGEERKKANLEDVLDARKEERRYRPAER